MDSRIFLAGAFDSLISIFDFPIGFYTFVRIAVTLCAVYGAYYFFKDKKGIWIILALTAIFYNPFIPIYLNEKDLWVFINLLTFLVFIYSYHISPDRYPYDLDLFIDKYRIVFIHGGKFILSLPILFILYIVITEINFSSYRLGEDLFNLFIFFIILEFFAAAFTLIWNRVFNKKFTIWMSNK